MIAHVVPVTRIRRHTNWWSYRIPAHTVCHPGSLVVISFRGHPCLGIIWKIEKDDVYAKKVLEEVLSIQPLLRTAHRQSIEWLSQTGLCSLSSALFQWLPRSFRTLPLSKKTRQLLAAHNNWKTPLQPAKQHALLVPSHRPLQALQLTERYNQQFCQLFSTSTAEEELEQWLMIARGEITVGMGRERALTAPWLNLNQISVIDPEDISYYHEQIPYLNLGEAAQAIADFHNASYCPRSYLPPSVTTTLYGPTALGKALQSPQLSFIDLRKEELLSLNLIQTIQKTLQKNQRILILYNAHDRLQEVKEEGKSFQKTIPGIETLAKKLARLLDLPSISPSIILGTRSILHEQYQNIGLTIILSLDPLLNSSLFADQLHGLSDLCHLFNYAAPCLLQTYQLDHPLVEALQSHTLESYILTLVKEQQEHNLPPFSQQIVCSFPNSALTLAFSPEVQALYTQLQSLSIEPWQISHPMKARWRQKVYDHILLCAPPNSRVPLAIRTLLVALPRPWKIQHNPWYLI